LDVAEKGQSAIDFLYTNCLSDESGPCPHLIIPDINLPQKSGKEVLAEIKRHPDTLRIPVIMPTGSDDPLDICETFRLHANCYVTEPNDMDQFKATIQSIQEFRTKISQLPQENP
jgi:two-component system, chemotaxis family, response regulator Rcp1